MAHDSGYVGDDREMTPGQINSSKHLGGGLQQQATLFLPLFYLSEVRSAIVVTQLIETLGLSLMGRSHCGTEPHCHCPLTASAQKRPMLGRPKQISRPLLSSTGQGHIIFPLTKISHRGAGGIIDKQ